MKNIDQIYLEFQKNGFASTWKLNYVKQLSFIFSLLNHCIVAVKFCKLLFSNKMHFNKAGGIGIYSASYNIFYCSALLSKIRSHMQYPSLKKI